MLKKVVGWQNLEICDQTVFITAYSPIVKPAVPLQTHF